MTVRGTAGLGLGRGTMMGWTDRKTNNNDEPPLGMLVNAREVKEVRGSLNRAEMAD